MQCKSCGQNNIPEARFCANCGASLESRVEPVATLATTLPTSVKPVVTVAYMGFWIRLGAAVIDAFVILAVSGLLRLLRVGAAPVIGFALVSFLVPWLYLWLFTGIKGQTLGKMAVGIKVVDQQGNIPGLGPAALREVLGKVISGIAFCIGFLWIIWDKQKQGWHDKIANTYVIRVNQQIEDRSNYEVP